MSQNRALVDYLIIGQGLAGSVLAMTLLQKGKSVMVFDSPEPNTSSAVAAGIMNPITGKRMTLTWMAEPFFTKAHAYYAELEKSLDTQFFYPASIYRVFSSMTEQNDWMGKADDEMYAGFASSNQIDVIDNKAIRNPFGSMKVNGGGRLDVPSFLAAVKEHLLAKQAYVQTNIEESDLQFEENSWKVLDVTAAKVVFCTGINKAIFDFLPINAVKGEVLEVNLPNFDYDNILVGGCFVSPIANKTTYYAGATYRWNTLDLSLTEDGKQEILNRMTKFIDAEVEVVSQRAGLRPTVIDRRPLLGKHPQQENMYFFGGLGSKGVSMAPSLAENFFQFVEEGVDLPKEMNLDRFL